MCVLSTGRRGPAGRSTTSLTCHIWALNLLVDLKSTIKPLWLVVGAQTRPDLWRVREGSVVCKSSIGRGHTSCLPPAAVHLQVKKTGEKTQRKNKGGKGRRKEEAISNTSLLQLLLWCGWAIYWLSQDALCQGGQGSGKVRQDRGGRTKQANMNDREWGDPFLWAHWWWHTCLSSRLAL